MKHPLHTTKTKYHHLQKYFYIYNFYSLRWRLSLCEVEVYGEKTGEAAEFCTNLPDTDLGAPVHHENCYFTRLTGQALTTKSTHNYTSLDEASNDCLPGT